MTIYHVYALVVVFVVLFGGNNADPIPGPSVISVGGAERGPNVKEVPIALTDASMGRVL